jgi:hypothetical protein
VPHARARVTYPQTQPHAQSHLHRYRCNPAVLHGPACWLGRCASEHRGDRLVVRRDSASRRDSICRAGGGVDGLRRAGTAVAAGRVWRHPGGRRAGEPHAVGSSRQRTGQSLHHPEPDAGRPRGGVGGCGECVLHGVGAADDRGWRIGVLSRCGRAATAGDDCGSDASLGGRSSCRRRVGGAAPACSADSDRATDFSGDRTQEHLGRPLARNRDSFLCAADVADDAHGAGGGLGALLPRGGGDRSLPGPAARGRRRDGGSGLHPRNDRATDRRRLQVHSVSARRRRGRNGAGRARPGA